MNGRPQDAIRTLQPVIQFAQKMPKVLLIYAQALGNIGQNERCAETLRTVCKQTPSDTHVRTEYAVALARCGKYESALENARKVRAAVPHYSRAANLEAELLMDLGRNEESLGVLDTFLRETPDDQLDTTARANLCSTRSRLAPGLVPAEDVADELAAFARNEEVKSYLRGIVASRAARLLDVLGRYDEAFEMASLAKEIRNVPWDAAAHTRQTDAMIGAWTSQEAAALPTSSVDGSGMVFIVGMPRSGTSLLEQMLARHPEVQGTGEQSDVVFAASQFQPPRVGELPMITNLSRLTPDNVQLIAEQIAARINARRESGTRYLVDKQPFNFQYVPLIAKLFPGAKVLHTVRDGRDTCVSYFMQWFNGRHGQCNSFDTLGRYYTDYRRTMEAWKSLPEPAQRPKMLDVSYEALVAEPERVMREIMGFLGMDFDPVVLDTNASDQIAVTASRDQVKEDIYTTSVERWRRYESHLAPFMRHAGRYFENA